MMVEHGWGDAKSIRPTAEGIELVGPARCGFKEPMQKEHICRCFSATIATQLQRGENSTHVTLHTRAESRTSAAVTLIVELAKLIVQERVVSARQQGVQKKGHEQLASASGTGERRHHAQPPRQHHLEWTAS